MFSNKSTLTGRTPDRILTCRLLSTAETWSRLMNITPLDPAPQRRLRAMTGSANSLGASPLGEGLF